MILRFLLLGAGLALAACGPTDQAYLQASAPAETATAATNVAASADDESEAKEARADAAKADAAAQRAADSMTRRALAGSLAAYARKEAGLPPETPTGKKGAPAAPRVYAFAPVNFEIAGAPASPASAATTAALAPSLSASAPALATPALATLGGSAPRWRAAYDGVQTSCFPDTLRRALDQIATHFNSEVLVTSGGRARGRRGSLHRSCKAADIRVAGVSPGALAAYARNVPNVNGVGTYRWVSVTHIDVRDEKFAWRW